MENEKTFSTLSFMKLKLHNQSVKHLNITIHVFAQHFFIKETFFFWCAITYWNDGDKVKVGVNA